jgi:hypothetical protein
MKYKSILLSIIQAALIVPAFALAADVEVTLKDNLDGDLNGYCLDIKGGGQNIDPSRGLQAHTCYSYRGELGPDQGIDPDGVAEGTFKITAFDVCATMQSTEAGVEVALSECDGGDMQRFDISDNGFISPKSAPGMCLTAGKETTFGRGGTSPHQIKTLTLQACGGDLTAYQEWYTRTQADYENEQGE